MALHFSVSPIGRSGGRSAAGAAAYMSAGRTIDSYTGTKLDYTRKTKPVAVDYFGTAAKTPQDFAHALDSKETRKNSQVAREFVLSLPASAAASERVEIVREFSAQLVKRYGAPVMTAIHKPDRKGDQRNHHVHILMGTRDREGRKLRVLDCKDSAAVEIAALREFAARIIQLRVPAEEREKWTHLSHAARGLKIPPMQHEGARATAIRRRGGKPLKPAALFNDAHRAFLTEGHAYGEKKSEVAEAAREVEKFATEKHQAGSAAAEPTTAAPKNEEMKLNKTTAGALLLGEAAGAVLDAANGVKHAAEGVAATLAGKEPEKAPQKPATPAAQRLANIAAIRAAARKKGKGGEGGIKRGGHSL